MPFVKKWIGKVSISSRLSLWLLVAAAVGFFVIFPHLYKLFSAGLIVETPFQYIVTEKNNTVRPVPSGINIPLRYPAQKMTTLHLSAWILGPGTLSLSLENETEGTSTLLAKRPVLRHVGFDLTPHLTPGQEYCLRLRVEDPSESSASIVQELVVKQMPQIPAFPRVDLYFLVLVAVFVALKKLPVISLLFAASFSIRWKLLAESVGHPLEGDAIGYYSLARQLQLSNPLATEIREPLYVWLQCLVYHVFGASQLFFRLTTLVISVGSVVITFYLTKALSKRIWAAAAAAGLMSFGEFVVWNSIRGERSELYSFLILLFCLVLVHAKKGSWKLEGGIGALAGLISLTWLIGGVACVLAYVGRWVTKKIKVREAGLFFIALFLIVAPHLIYQWKVSGDALRPLNAHTNFYKNARERGRASYEGASRSLARYLFIDQGPGLVKQALYGYVNLFLNPLNPFNKIFLGFHHTKKYSYLLFPFLVLGLVGSVYEKNKRIFWLVFAVLNVSTAFLSVVRDPRLFLQAAFFIAYFFGVGLDGVYRYVVFRRGKIWLANAGTADHA